MAVDKLVDSTQLNTDLTSIANAIRTKGGTSAQLAFPSGFVTAIGNIPTGGGESIVITDEANATGTTAVVTGDEISLITKTITLNGTYDPDDDNADGYSGVTVNVQNGASMTQTQGTYGTEVVITSASGGGSPSATQHSIYFEFTDGTDTTILVYYNDALLSTMITAYTPEVYGGKTVNLAQLDGVTWYERPDENWETLYEDNAKAPNTDTPYNFWWIASLEDVYLTVGSVWRITIDNNQWILTAKTDPNVLNGDGIFIGNPLYSGGQDDGSGVTTNFYNAGWGAWVGDTEISADILHYVKVERRVSA